MPRNLYEVIDLDTGEGDHYIKITDGPFMGVTFQFGQIAFMGEDSEGNALINFGYTFMPDSPRVPEDSLDSLHEVMGTILHTILESISEQPE
jgi:hypothetical protein